MNSPNAYCKKHDEIEPQDNESLWVCPQCSKNNMKRLTVRDENGKLPLDAALEKMEAMRIKETCMTGRR